MFATTRRQRHSPGTDRGWIREPRWPTWSGIARGSGGADDCCVEAKTRTRTANEEENTGVQESVVDFSKVEVARRFRLEARLGLASGTLLDCPDAPLRPGRGRSHCALSPTRRKKGDFTARYSIPSPKGSPATGSVALPASIFSARQIVSSSGPRQSSTG